MSFDADALYKLLPEIHRLRDAERDEPLRALLAVIADQIALLEESLSQLHDDQFVETSAPWVLPYIADLLGITGLPSAALGAARARAEVGHTIAYRRRKGTAAVLEQLAFDATGFPARAVEMFQLVGATQFMNHLRPENLSLVSVRDAARFEHLGGAFERLARRADLPHTADVRTIPARDGARRVPLIPPGGALDPALDALPLAGVGGYAIPNVALFLFRVRAEPVTRSDAFALAARRFTFDPLGADVTLWNAPLTERELTHLAEPINVPGRISRRALHEDLRRDASDHPDERYYGGGIRVEIMRPGLEPALVPASEIEAADLGDWSRDVPPAKTLLLDPALGRVKLRDAPAGRVLVSYHRGVTGALGGGAYPRGTAASARALTTLRVSRSGPFTTVQAALDALPTSGGVIRIEDSARYVEDLTVPALPALEIRAADKHRPTLLIRGGTLTLHGAKHEEITLSGLLIEGRVVVGDPIRSLRIEHTTLVPGSGSGPSLTLMSADTRLVLDHSIAGPLAIVEEATTSITSSIIDAGAATAAAYSALDGSGPGGALSLIGSTVVGKVHASTLTLVSNSILLAELGEADPWPAPVRAERRQEGCVRFSYVPPGSRVPRRSHCQPAIAADAARVRPMFDSIRRGDPEYARLSLKCADEIRRGADDGSEMGAFCELTQPQREDHLRARLQEYLRFGLEAGIVYAT